MKAVFIPQKADFSSVLKGEQTTLVNLKNANGMQVGLTNYGARIVSIIAPNKQDGFTEVNVGHKQLEEYTKEKANYYGAIIGRVCGRIREAKFTIDDKEYVLPPNDGDNFLHGGENAFHTQVFTIADQIANAVTFSYRSTDGEEGFPGNLTLEVTYTLTDENELQLQVAAVSDQKTPINITNHAFFNLNGEGSGKVDEQRLQVFTDTYLPIEADVLPTGELLSVKNTPFDFTVSKPIGQDINADHQQIQFANGYDHTFVLKKHFDQEVKHAARAESDQTGIVMDVYTNQPGVHLYTGNFMEGTFQTKAGVPDDFRTAFCLETQHLADALNQPNFPAIVLQPEVPFKAQTNFKFSINS